MTKSPNPLALTLRFWASKIERNLLTPEEAQTIATVLRRVADGEDFDAAIGVRRMANRPPADKTKYYVEQVYGLTQQVYSLTHKQLTPGMQVKQAIAEVAKACHVSTSTVNTAYYSPEGRRYLDEIRALLSDPLT